MAKPCLNPDYCGTADAESLCDNCLEEAERLGEEKKEDTGRYQSGYRIYRDGSYREDFGSDR